MLKIDPELEKLLPPLTPEEYAGLEADIVKNGCLSPLVAWKEIIVDGHHRHRICRKHDIPFKTENLEFDSLAEAKLWAWQHQKHRRNLEPFQRAEIALQFKEAIVKRAKRKQSQAGGDRKSAKAKSLLENSPEAVPGKTTRQEIAEIAGLSDNTIARAEFLDKHADEVTKEKLRAGQTSINKEYKRIKERINCDEFVTETDPVTGVPTKTETLRRVTLQNIRRDDPETLINCILTVFDASYRTRLICGLLLKMQEEDGAEHVTELIEQINQLFSKGAET